MQAEEGPEKEAPNERVEFPPDLFNSLYTVIANRRTAFDTLMWQVPALGLAAQAFLLTIAFGSSSSEVARCLSGALAIVVALVAIQTMLKHRANEKTDNLILKELEVNAGIWIRAGVTPHDSPAVRGRAVENDLIEKPVARRRSANLWVTSLLCFAAAGAAAVVLALLDSAALSG